MTLYLDRYPDPSRTVFVLSSARSGSTILAEILVRARPLRLIFEPLRRDRVPLSRAVRWGQYVNPAIGDETVESVLDRVVIGDVRSLWSDRFNASYLPVGRIVKEIRATNLLPLLVARYPETPIVYLLRHPLAAAVSASDLHWNNFLDEFLSQDALMSGPLAPYRDIVERTAATDRGSVTSMVLRWCLENSVPLRSLQSGTVHVVFYEDLVRYPERELERLFAYLKAQAPHLWSTWSPNSEALSSPSATSYRDGRSLNLTAEQRAADWWTKTDPQTLEQSLQLLRVFALDHVYGPSTRPLLSADSVLPR